MRKKWMTACAVLALMVAMSPVSIAEPRHPEIRAALESLHNAKDHLQHAAHDFGGHRADAIRAIDDAIHQLEICMKYD
jgi:hypothetical protein